MTQKVIEDLSTYLVGKKIVETKTESHEGGFYRLFLSLDNGKWVKMPLFKERLLLNPRTYSFKDKMQIDFNLGLNRKITGVNTTEGVAEYGSHILEYNFFFEGGNYIQVYSPKGYITKYPVTECDKFLHSWEDK